jgi:glycosyltransferase involved in cell wall biosynthesis
MPLAIASWLTGWSLERWDPFDTILFDRLATLKMRECDVLHGWSGYSLRSGQRVKRQGGVFVLERHCPHVDFQESLVASEAEVLGVPYRPKPDFWMDRSHAEYALADFIVVPSAYSRRSFLERGFDAKKIVRAPLDVPMLYRGRPAPRARGDVFVVGTLGGNMLRKGFEYLLEAWKRLALPNARLLIKASERQLRRSPILRQYLDSCPNVEVLGYIPDIASFYRRCDVFCLASVDDGFGLGMLEALANGVPVVVTENVGAAELLPGTGAGVVVPIRSADALAEKILSLYQDPALRAQMGENALRFSERLIETPGGYFNSIRELYGNVAALGPTRAGRCVSA